MFFRNVAPSRLLLLQQMPPMHILVTLSALLHFQKESTRRWGRKVVRKELEEKKLVVDLIKTQACMRFSNSKNNYK